jgi:hypothetical protein
MISRIATYQYLSPKYHTILRSNTNAIQTRIDRQRGPDNNVNEENQRMERRKDHSFM